MKIRCYESSLESPDLVCGSCESLFAPKPPTMFENLFWKRVYLNLGINGSKSHCVFMSLPHTHITLAQHPSHASSELEVPNAPWLPLPHCAGRAASPMTTIRPTVVCVLDPHH
jgi:hypothetical protein